MTQEHEIALPPAVRKQIAQANAILDEMKKAEEAAAAEGAPGDPPKEEPATPPTGEPVTPPKEEPATPPEGEPVTPPKEEPAPTPKEKPVEDPAEHKYKVLQGKYNAEVPRLQSDLKAERESGQELRQRLLNVEGLLASLQHVQEKPVETPAPEPTISQEEIDQFGPDLVDLIRRVATDAAKPVVEAGVAPVKEDVSQVRESTSQVQNSMAQSARKRLFATLAEAVPGWEQQNENPEFLQWLDEVDPFSGQKRGILLTHAFNASDTGRVIALFKGFLTENAAVNEPAAPAPVPVITPEPQTTLDALVAPGTPKTGSDSAPNESGKRLWTKQDISALYAAKNEAIVAGKQVSDELLALERDLIKAQKEGRVRY